MLDNLDIKQIGLLSLFGLSLMWSPMFGTAEELLFPSLAVYEHAALISRVCNLAAFGLVMGIFSFFGERLRQMGTNRSALMADAAVGSVGMLLGVLVGLEVLPLPLLYVGAFLRGLFYGVLTVFWIEVLIHLDGNGIGVAVAASLMLYAIAGIGFYALSQVAPVAVALLLVACPLLSSLGCVAAQSNMPMGEPIAQESAKAPFITRCLFYVANFLFGLMLGALLYYFALYDSLASTAAFFAATAALFLAFWLGGETMAASEVFRGAMMVMSVVAAIVMVSGLLTHTVAKFMASSALAFLILYTVIIFADTQARSRNPYWKLPGMCQVFASLGMIAGACQFSHVFPDGAVSPMELVLLAVVCIIFVAGVFTPNERTRQRPWGFSSLIPLESPEARAMRRCGELAEECGLTSRELEILQKLAVGMGKDEIAEALVISPTTAKTHIRNIYGKLGVHSQKELVGKLDL